MSIQSIRRDPSVSPEYKKTVKVWVHSITRDPSVSPEYKKTVKVWVHSIRKQLKCVFVV